MDEKQALLETQESHGDVSTSLIGRLSRSRPKYVEAAFFMYYVSYNATVPLVEQFVHYQIQQQQQASYLSYLPYLQIRLPDVERTPFEEPGDEYASCGGNESGLLAVVDGLMERSVQSKSSTWLMFIDLALTVPAVFSTLIICSYGDIAGRKLGITLAAVGSAFRTCLYILTIYFQWSPVMYLVGTFFDGLSGSTLTFFGSCCAYVADTSSVNKRAFRFIVLQSLNTFANALANIFIGYVIAILGYTWAFWIIGFMQVVNCIYIVVGIPDSKPMCHNPAPQLPLLRRRSSLQQLKEGTVSVTKRAISSFLVLSEKTGQSYGRLKLGLLLASFLTTAIIALGISPVQTLYMLAPPICWDSILIGYYNAINGFLHGAVGMIGVWFLTKVMKDVSVAIIGSVSHMLGKVVFGLAKGSIMLYVSLLAGIGANVVFPLLRALMSRIVGPSKQGALFASIFSLETVMDVSSGVAMNAIYTATLNINTGIVFFVGAAMIGVSTALICVYYMVESRTTRGSLQHLLSQTVLEQEVNHSEVKDTRTVPVAADLERAVKASDIEDTASETAAADEARSTVTN